MPWITETEDHLTLSIRVIPRASRDSIQGIHGDTLKIRIQAPPVEGKANAYLVKFLSKQWKVSRACIQILSGETGRNKRLRISNPSDELRKTLLSIGDG